MEGESNNISNSRFKGVLGKHNVHCAKANVEFSYHQLFQKELTPNDVGNNRFVIPRKYATKYFHQIQHNEEMDFYDTSRKSWKFRFIYCQSSQKYMFTKGWSKFVRDKSLRVGDTIAFNLCESNNGINENCNTFVIDVVKNVEVLPMDLAVNHHQQEEFMRAQPVDHVAVVAGAALTPVLLFGKQIGWTEIKKENEV